MTVTQQLVDKYLILKNKHNWSDEKFLTIIQCCNVPRKALSDFFDECVARKEMKPLEQMETVGEIRKQVMATSLPKEEKFRFGKCIALMQQLKNPL